MHVYLVYTSVNASRYPRSRISEICEMLPKGVVDGFVVASDNRHVRAEFRPDLYIANDFRSFALGFKPI